MNKYYLVVGNHVQLSSFIVKVYEPPNIDGTFLVTERHNIGHLPFSATINDIAKRELHFQNRSFQTSDGILFRETYYGWTISQKEFDNLARACQLWKSWKEFRDILELP